MSHLIAPFLKEIMKLLELLSLDPSMSQILSPLLCDTLFWTLERVVKTYFFPKSDYYERLDASYGEFSGERGIQYVEHLIQKTRVNARLWNADEDALTEMLHLLKALIANATVSNYSSSSVEFEGLLGELLQGMDTMPSSIHPKIIELIVSFASSLPSDSSSAYFSKMSSLLQSYFGSLVSNPSFSAVCQQTHVLSKVVNSLDMFCGMLTAASDSNSRILYSIILPYFPAFEHLLAVYKEGQVPYFVFRIFAELGKYLCFSSLSAQEIESIHRVLYSLIEKHKVNVVGKKRKESDEDGDVEVILELLTSFLHHEVEQVEESARKSMTVKLEDVVFFGLGSLLPVVQEEIARNDALFKKYIELVTGITMYASASLKFASPEFLEGIAKTLLVALESDVQDISSGSYTILSNLFRFAFADHETKVRFVSFSETFLATIFDTLLFKKYNSSEKPNMLLALLYLLLCSRVHIRNFSIPLTIQDGLEKYVSNLLSHASQGFHAALIQIFSELLNFLGEAGQLVQRDEAKVISMFEKVLDDVCVGVKSYLK